jgi:hypothetical protein
MRYSRVPTHSNRRLMRLRAALPTRGHRMQWPSGCIACAQWLRVSDSPAQPRNRCHVSSCAPQSPRVCDRPHATCACCLSCRFTARRMPNACAARRCRTRQTRFHHCPSSVLTGHASSVRLSRRRGLAPISFGAPRRSLPSGFLLPSARARARASRLDHPSAPSCFRRLGRCAPRRPHRHDMHPASASVRPSCKWRCAALLRSGNRRP